MLDIDEKIAVCAGDCESNGRSPTTVVIAITTTTTATIATTTTTTTATLGDLTNRRLPKVVDCILGLRAA